MDVGEVAAWLENVLRDAIENTPTPFIAVGRGFYPRIIELTDREDRSWFLLVRSSGRERATDAD